MRRACCRAAARHRRILWVGAIIFLLWPAARVARAAEGEAASDRGRSVAAPSAPAPGAGMRVYIDPRTGKVGPPPAAVPPAAAPEAAGRGRAAAPVEPLVEVPGRSAAGGYTVDLRRRLRGDVAARRDGSGNVDVECVEHGAPCPAAE